MYKNCIHENIVMNSAWVSTCYVLRTLLPRIRILKLPIISTQNQNLFGGITLVIIITLNGMTVLARIDDVVIDGDNILIPREIKIVTSVWRICSIVTKRKDTF